MLPNYVYNYIIVYNFSKVKVFFRNFLNYFHHKEKVLKSLKSVIIIMLIEKNKRSSYGASFIRYKKFGLFLNGAPQLLISELFYNQNDVRVND